MKLKSEGKVADSLIVQFNIIYLEMSCKKKKKKICSSFRHIRKIAKSDY